MPKPRKTAKQLRDSGSRHYSKAQLEEREATEPKPVPGAVEPPPYLADGLRPKFRELAAVLVAMGTLTRADADTLARYLIAEREYLRCTKKLTDAINSGNATAAAQWSAMQDRFYKQLRAGAADLGLNARARGGITLPPEPTEPGREDELFGD